MQVIYGIQDLTSIPVYRDRATDPVTIALHEGRPVKLTETADFDATQMRRLAKRLADRARRRGLRQTRQTVGEAGQRVMTVQWYRETPGDAIGLTPPAWLLWLNRSVA